MILVRPADPYNPADPYRIAQIFLQRSILRIVRDLLAAAGSLRELSGPTVVCQMATAAIRGGRRSRPAMSRDTGANPASGLLGCSAPPLGNKIVTRRVVPRLFEQGGLCTRVSKIARDLWAKWVACPVGGDSDISIFGGEQNADREFPPWLPILASRHTKSALVTVLICGR